MRKALGGEKLRNLVDMYNAFVPPDRWPAQIIAMSNNCLGEIKEIDNTEWDHRAISLCGSDVHDILRIARIHSLLRRDRTSASLSDAVICKRMTQNPHYAIRTMPRRNRSTVDVSKG